MSGRIFIDTNLWIYLFSHSEKVTDVVKRNTVNDLLKNSSDIIVSVQVLSEMSNVFLKKLKLPVEKVRGIVFELGESVDVIPLDESNIAYALDLVDRYLLSWYDALIAASAISAQAEILYSEDMQHGMSIDKSVRIVNPFL